MLHGLFGWLTGRGRNTGATLFSQLALRLERDLAPADLGSTLTVVGADDDGVSRNVVSELAWHLAEDFGRDVLIVDATFGSQGLGAELTSQGLLGLTDMLNSAAEQRKPLNAFTQATAHERVKLLASGQRTNGHAVPLRKDAIRAALDEACRSYDFVLIQASSMMSGDRSWTFLGLTDVALLVAVEGRTRIDALDVARNRLAECGATRVALVLANQDGSGRSKF